MKSAVLRLLRLVTSPLLSALRSRGGGEPSPLLSALCSRGGGEPSPLSSLVSRPLSRARVDRPAHSARPPPPRGDAVVPHHVTSPLPGGEVEALRSQLVAVREQLLVPSPSEFDTHAAPEAAHDRAALPSPGGGRDRSAHTVPHHRELDGSGGSAVMAALTLEAASSATSTMTRAEVTDVEAEVESAYGEVIARLKDELVAQVMEWKGRKGNGMEGRARRTGNGMEWKGMEWNGRTSSSHR